AQDDGEAEHLTEAGGEDEQPHQRPHQCGDEAFALMQEAKRLAPHDAVQAGEIFAKREAAPDRPYGHGGHDVGLPLCAEEPVSRMNAVLISLPPVSAITRATLPWANT